MIEIAELNVHLYQLGLIIILKSDTQADAVSDEVSPDRIGSWARSTRTNFL